MSGPGGAAAEPRAPTSLDPQAARARAAGSFVVLAAAWAAAFRVDGVPLLPTLVGGGLVAAAAGAWVRRRLDRPPPLRVATRGAALALVVAALHYLAARAAFDLFAALAPGFATATADVLARIGSPAAWPVVVTAALVASLEELYWRGALQPVVAAGRPGRLLVPVGATTAAYTLFHVATLEVALVAAAALGGLVWGTLAARTTVGAAMIAHGAWTALMVAFPPT